MLARRCRGGLSRTDFGLEIADGFPDGLLGVEATGLRPRHEVQDLVAERGRLDRLGGQRQRNPVRTGPADDLARSAQGRQPLGNPFQGGRPALLGRLALLPHAVQVGGRGLGGEHVRVPTDQLVADSRRHVVEVEPVSRLARQLGVEHHLEEQVAELLLQVRGGRPGPAHGLPRQPLDGLHHLAGLLHQVGNQAPVGLLGVPRALRPQGAHHRDEPLELRRSGHRRRVSCRRAARATTTARRR